MSRLVINFSINVGVTETLSSFRLILGGKADKEILELSRLPKPTSRPLNRGCITDLPSSKALLAIHKKSQEKEGK